MCGIAGLINRKGNTADPALVRRMTDAMAHRGPDADGLLADGEAAFGHRRLSIIDLSSAANQPFVDASGRYMMVFNGEMYNYQEVKAMLPEYPFRTTSDTEALLAAYIKWGADCIRHFRGMFAFAVWDREEKQLFMARDRMGVKPLYYYLDDNYLIFSSEVRSILATGLVEKKISQPALVEYFSYQSISHPWSAIEGIRQLEAGTWMRIGRKYVESGRYWDVTSACSDVDTSDATAVKKHIRELLLQSVRRRLVSDVPVGAFLSGGIDSSAVVGLMAEAGGVPPNTFNVYFEEKEYDESPYAEIIAKKFNTRHTSILLRPTVFLEELENALNAMDSPSGDGVNTYVVSKVIRNSGITVALSGIGGDELFSGYPFFEQYLQLRQKGWLWKTPAGLRRMAGAVLPTKGKTGRLGQLLGSETPDIGHVYPIFRQLLSPSLLHKLTSLPGVDTTEVQRELMGREAAIDRLPLLSQVSVAEYLGYTQHTLLKDTDQMSMASSLEVREPFFDHDLVEFVLSIPDELKKPTYPKSLLVESLKPLLPDEIVFRKKQGFVFPWNIWLKNELRSFCDKHIQNMAKRPFINGKELLAYWQRFLNGDSDTRWGEIWLFVVLEYWLDRNGIS
ncbi:MAG: asparagine synthase (glutamine-hydrolyzing) [Bacteroidetes bacterium]|nr:asparagine synthase (glutamine-hydrolyzing) [Bacteroidota bacterium]